MHPALSVEDAQGIGAGTLMTGNFTAVKAYCDAAAACVGMAVGTTPNSYRAFNGTKWEGAVGKDHAWGSKLNMWIP